MQKTGFDDVDMDGICGEVFRGGFEQVGVDELVGSGCGGGREHVAEERESVVVVVGGGGVGGDEGGEEVDVGGVDVVEDEASVGKVGESEGTEANKLEGVEVGLGVTQGC